MHPPGGQSSGARAWTLTGPVALLLGLVVAHFAISQGSGQIISLGEALWPGYASELRLDRPRPTPPQTEPEAAADEGLIDDLLGDEEPPGGEADAELIADLLGDEDQPSAQGPPGEGEADDALIADLLGEDAPAATTDPAADARARYERQLEEWESAHARLSPGVRAFRAVDTTASAFASWGARQFRPLLVLLIMLCGIAASLSRHHIALRPTRSLRADRISRGAQLLANLLVVISQIALFRNEQLSGTEIDQPYLPLLWAAGFAVMAAVDLRALLRPDPELSPGGSLGRGLLAVPLYATMALMASAWFLLGEGYLAGLAVYLQKLTEHAQLYVFVGLYVWAGMLLKRTRLAPRVFDLLRPWRLTPELLAIVIVTGAAVPTAYSGASGIFVIAIGALVYRELLGAGARPQLALAATAMSGSLGVVLRPCLLVVIVAYLNPVTTDVLYGWGRWVFVLSASLFAIVVLLTADSKLRVAPITRAMPESLRLLRPLLPYLLVGVGALLTYRLLLGASVDEHSAALILPVILALFLWLESRSPQDSAPALPRLQEATSETTVHIGALLLLMALSIALGGVFERSEVMSLVPDQLGSPVSAMAALVVVLVVVGMTMDPYGAVILVSATIAEVAYSNGIGEAHFWMVVLVAFELGYLTPPVALNHLLTRQVVSQEAFDHAATSLPPDASFWRRHERLLLPLTVMAITLLLVAFVPLGLGY